MARGFLLVGLGWMLVLLDPYLVWPSQGSKSGFWVVTLNLREEEEARFKGSKIFPGINALILEEDQGGIPEIVALGGLRARKELESIVIELNRGLEPDRRTFVSWPSTGYQRGGKSGLALVSRFPLVRLRNFTPLGSSSLLYGLLDAWGEPLHVFVVWWTLTEREGLDHRTKELAEICRDFADSLLRAQPEAALLILGDFGMPMNSPLLRKIRGLHGEESLRLFPLDIDKDRSRKASEGTAHMLVSKVLYGNARDRLRGFGAVPRRGGRHAAVWGWVSWPKERRRR